MLIDRKNNRLVVLGMGFAVAFFVISPFLRQSKQVCFVRGIPTAMSPSAYFLYRIVLERKLKRYTYP